MKWNSLKTPEIFFRVRFEYKKGGGFKIHIVIPMNEITYRTENNSIENNFIIDLLLDSPVNDSHASYLIPIHRPVSINRFFFFIFHHFFRYVFKTECHFRSLTDQKRKEELFFFFKWQHKIKLKRYVNAWFTRIDLNPSKWRETN